MSVTDLIKKTKMRATVGSTVRGNYEPADCESEFDEPEIIVRPHQGYSRKYRPERKITSSGKDNLRHVPSAFCNNCGKEQAMRWKPEGSRGKSVDTWFVCAVCGCDNLEIKQISQSEAVAKNKLNTDRLVKDT